MFSNKLGRLMHDRDHSVGEERFILIGKSSQHSLLTVCHCERDSGTIRIISARKADTFERKQYEGYSHS